MTLSVLQTIGIVALVVHAFGEEHPAAPGQHTSNSSAVAISPDTGGRVISAAPDVDEERLPVIREELAQFAPGGYAYRRPAPTPSSADARQREVVAQQIEAYAAAGAITDTQMQELQAEVAQLDDASRKQMMSRLIRALNWETSKAGYEVSFLRLTGSQP